MSVLFYEKKDPYYEFSNYYMAPITIDGILYQSTEYYYQAQKFMGPSASKKDLAYAKVIRDVNTSNKARILATQTRKGGYASKWYVSKSDPRLLNDLILQSKEDGVQMREDWNIVRDNVMRKAVWAKYTQHSKLKKLLLGTGAKVIVENSPRDSYWGIGKDGKGENMLGRILMEVRSLLSGNREIPEFLVVSDGPTKHNIRNADIILSFQKGLKPYYKMIAPEFTLPDNKLFCNKIWSAVFKRPIIIAQIPIKNQKIAYLEALADIFVRAIGKHERILILENKLMIGLMLQKMYGLIK
jgi:ribA/ribD-fused uncharacterized protein